MYEIFLVRPDIASISGDDLYNTYLNKQVSGTWYYEASNSQGGSWDKTKVAFFQIHAIAIDFTDGQELKTTRGPNYISFQFGLKKEIARTCAISEIYVGNASDAATKRYLNALTYAKTEWSKIPPKLTALFIYDVDNLAEDETFYQYNGTTYARFKGGISQFTPHIDLNMNVSIPQLVLEGAWQ